MTESNLIKISEMASLHGISRQALILYDKNDLLKPIHVAENGYRYYSPDQIPRLRMICLLKAMGIPLSSIGSYLDGVSADAMVKLLTRRATDIEDEMAHLAAQRDDIMRYMDNYEHISTRERNQDVPMVQWLPERKAIYVPYPTDSMDHKQLHLTLMDAWGSLLDAGMIPSLGFGSMLKVASVEGERPLEGAGCIIFLPRDLPVEGAQVITFHEGEYATMYKRAMPYDVEPAKRLLSWMRERGLTPARHVVDRCLLDATFYGDGLNADFCHLAIRIKN